jgi:GNAT superfamily N-acetyltransferase
LVRSAENWCRQKGLMTMTLNVGSVNIPATRLYESMGYKCQSTVMRRMLK